MYDDNEGTENNLNSKVEDDDWVKLRTELCKYQWAKKGENTYVIYQLLAIYCSVANFFSIDLHNDQQGGNRMFLWTKILFTLFDLNLIERASLDRITFGGLLEFWILIVSGHWIQELWEFIDDEENAWHELQSCPNHRTCVLSGPNMDETGDYFMSMLQQGVYRVSHDEDVKILDEEQDSSSFLDKEELQYLFEGLRSSTDEDEEVSTVSKKVTPKKTSKASKKPDTIDQVTVLTKPRSSSRRISSP